MASRRIAVALLCLAACALPAAGESATSDALYRAGRTDDARTTARRELAAVEAGDDDGALWTQLMYVAWLEESLGAHRDALRYANRALDIAHRLGDPYSIGRSLSWIGWSYTSLGLYELALEFYGEAVELGTDANGGIAIVPLWGLATQETGAIYARMGRLDEAAALIGKTTDFARRHGIDVGVAEGGAHLAEIALARGDLGEATERSDEALRAAIHCGCRPSNTARAYVVAARVAQARSRLDPRLRGDAVEAAQQALEFSQRYGDRRHAAEARLVLAGALDPQDFDRRVELVSSAIDSLGSIESELRGSANAELGRLYLERDLAAAAEGYLRHGLEINRELFRKLDNAYVLTDLAELDALRGDHGRSFEGWADAAARAEAAGALPLLADAQEQLSDALAGAGFAALSASWGERALGTLERLLLDPGDDTARRALLERVLALAERVAEVRLLLDREPPQEQGP